MKKTTIITTLLAVLLISCSKKNNDTITLSPLVFSIGDVLITAYEIEKNRTRNKLEYVQINNKSMSRPEIKEWEESFINRTYLLADAYQKGYDTLEEVNVKVQNMANIILTQANGLLAKKVLENELSINQPQVDTAISRRKIVKRIQYLKVDNYDQAVDLFGEDLEINAEEFSAITNSALGDGVSLGNEELTWPYSIFTGNKDYIYNLKKGELSKAIEYLNGYYLIYVIDIVDNEAHPMFEESREQIAQILKRSVTDGFQIQRSHDIMSHANISYNLDTANELVLQLSQGAAVIEFNYNHYQSFLNQNLFSYTLRNERIDVSFEAFFNYYNNLIMKKDIYTLNDLLSNAESMVSLVYDLELADELGVTSDTTYLLDRDNYKKKIVYFTYVRDELERNIEISESEKKMAYENNKEQYVQPLSITASIYITNNWTQARDMRPIMYSSVNEKKSLQVPENTKSYEHIDLQLGENSILADTLIRIAFDLPNKKISRPIAYKGNFYLIMKEAENGSRVKSLEEAENLVMERVIRERVEAEKSVLTNKLMEKFEFVKHDQYENYMMQP